jgi:hypothetical protein
MCHLIKEITRFFISTFIIILRGEDRAFQSCTNILINYTLDHISWKDVDFHFD